MINYLSQYKNQNDVDSWELLKKLYKQQFNVDAYVLDYIAVYDILNFCCQGRSVEYIANTLDFDVDYITCVLMEFFSFTGFVQDLDLNFRELYKRSKYNKYACISMAKTLDHITNEKVYNHLYAMNQKLDLIEERIEEYYERS